MSSKKPAVIQSAPMDPAYLLSPENFPEPTWLSDKYIPALCGIMGGGGIILHNVSLRRPFLAGIPYILAATVGGTALGIWYQKRSDRYFAERDAVYRHYISLHPEDFPAKERVLVGDLLKPWVPIR